MKKFLLGATALVALAGSAVAADMPIKAAPVIAAPSCAQFAGLYIGAHVGAAQHDWRWNDTNAWAANEVDVALPHYSSGTSNGWLGGAQLGYNFQFGCAVWGAVADWSWAGLDKTRTYTDGQTGLALDTLTVSNDLKWFGTLRTRSGVVVSNLLLYATGGLAYAKIDNSATLTNVGVPISETFSSSDTRWGWVAGVGAEWALSPNWSIKSEALYIRLEDSSSTFNSQLATLNGNPALKNFDHESSLWVARVGVNYRFGGWAAPVLANY